MHTCRNATVACFVGRKTRRALIFRWRSSFYPSALTQTGNYACWSFRQRSEKSISPEKWTVAATKMDNTFGNLWCFTINRSGGGWKKKSLNISSIILLPTNRKSMVSNLLRRDVGKIPFVGKMFWKFRNCWIRMMKLMKKKVMFFLIGFYFNY